MNRPNKFLCILVAIIFILNTLLPGAQACWWKGLPGLYPGMTGGPSGLGGFNDGKPNNEGAGEPVYLHNGDFAYTHQDLMIPGRGMSIDISRTYKSQSRYNGRYGLGWELSYNKRIVPLADGSVYYLDGDGGRSKFLYLDGTSYISPAEVFDTLTQNADGTYTIAKKGGTKYNFNQNGCLVEIVDRNNNKLTFSYDSRGKLAITGVPVFTTEPLPFVKTLDASLYISLLSYEYMLTKVTDATGRQVNFSYDTNGRLTQIADFSGRTISYAYDDFGHLTSYTDPAGNITQYSYDSGRNLRSITDPNGNEYLINTYNPDRQVIAQTYGGNSFYFSYDTATRTTTFTDRKGSIWTYLFDENGNPTQITDPQGNITTKTYDTNKKMLLTSVTYPKGNSVWYEYDDKGSVTKITVQPLPQSTEIPLTTTLTYESRYNFIKTASDPKGNITTYYYDYEESTLGDLNGDGVTSGAQGNLVKITAPAVNNQSLETTFTYNAYGELDTLTYPNSSVAKYEYYPLTGYLKKITNAYGTSLSTATSYSYDAVGNVISITDAKGNTTGFSYNNNNQVITTTAASPFNYQTKYTYDSNGNLVKLERQANTQGTQWQTREYVYNTIDNLTQVKEHLSGTEILTTQYEYDANENLTKVTDAEGNTTVNVYDVLNRLSSSTDSLGQVTGYSYDTNSNLSQITDAKNNSTVYNYDDFDRLIKTTYPDSTYEGYTYDVNSNLVTKRTRKGDSINYTYDNLNRIGAKTYPDNSQVTYAYDSASRLTAVTNASGVINYAYDALNRITSVDTQGKVISYEYDVLGNRTKLTYPDATFITYEYDQLTRLTGIKEQGISTVATYQYDPLSRRTQGGLANTTQSSYTYDNLDRLTKLGNRKTGQPADFSEYAYTYDKVGNRKALTTAQGTHNYSYDAIYQLTGIDYPAGYAAVDTTYTCDATGNRTQTVNGVTTSYTSNNLNQYTQTQVDTSITSYTYDANGNLINDGSRTFTYDYENLLMGVSASASEAIYTYDPLGRRTKKAVTVNSELSTVNYLYDGDQIIAEYDDAGNLTKKYIYGSGIDEPILMEKAGTKYYYHYDGLGSVTDITDSSSTQVEKYEYDAFGKPTLKDGAGNTIQTSSIGNRFMFTGREYDSETGLYNYRARYYSPVLGRFLQTDPVGYIDSMNLYTYVGNNSINLTDPFGLWSWKGAGQGLINVGKGVVIGAIVVGGVVLLLPASAATAVLGGAAIAGAVGLGLTTGQVITGKDLSGKKICDEKRSEMAVEAAFGWATLGIGAAFKSLPKSNVQQNKIKGDTFRDEIANLLTKEGLTVKTEVTKKTIFGRRVIDIEVSNSEGKVLGGIETKTGGSRYTPSQQAKDAWLKLNGYIVNVVRDK